VSAATEWVSALKNIAADVEFFPPVSAEAIAEVERSLGNIPQDIRDFLAQTNGLACRSFRLYSAFDPDQPKKTWESLQRANDSSTTQALGGDEELLARFLVFADIGSGVAVWDRTQDSIWFEEVHDDQLRQTDLSLREFVELMLRNAE